MKLLMALSVLQTIGIIVLVFHDFRAEPETATVAHPTNSPAADISPVSSPPVAEERLRIILREELTHKDGHLVATDVAAPAPPAPRRDLAADQQRREDVAQQIEAYKGIGAISETQMLDLQSEIAQLDEVSRRQMMSKLIRALNSGEIRGRF